MKVLGIIGSMNGERSREFQIIRKLINFDQYKDSEIKMITADSLYIKYCKGCCACFNTGICPLDSIDDMNDIKRYLLEADLIIISSPVYIHQISGFMKNLFDRLSYWSHTFRLVGKRIIVCTSTSNSGSEYSISYLKKVMSAFGGVVLGEIIVNDSTTDIEIMNKLSIINKRIDESIKECMHLNISTFQHTAYKGMRMLLIEKEGYEHNFWLEHHMFDYLTFNDYLVHKLQ